LSNQTQYDSIILALHLIQQEENKSKSQVLTEKLNFLSCSGKLPPGFIRNFPLELEPIRILFDPNQTENCPHQQITTDTT